MKRKGRAKGKAWVRSGTSKSLGGEDQGKSKRAVFPDRKKEEKTG